VKNQLGLGSGIKRGVFPLLDCLDGGLGENRVSPGYGGVFNGTAGRDCCIHTYQTADTNPLQIRRVFRFDPAARSKVISMDGGSLPVY
jgi:hypothetical protein